MRVSLAEAAGLSSCGRLFRGDSVDQRQRLMTVRQLVARLFASLACEHLLLSNKPLWRREPEDDDETDGSFDLDFNSGISAAQKNYNLEMTTRPELSLLHPSTLPSPYRWLFLFLSSPLYPRNIAQAVSSATLRFSPQHGTLCQG